MKKFLALLLALTMVLSLAACGGSEKPAETQAPAADAPAAETPAAEAADSVPTLVWYMVGGGQPANYDSWKVKMDAYLEEKIGVHLDVRVVSWGDWGNRRSVIVQTNEPYDLMFTDMGSYVSDVNMGAFADISDLMAEVPGLTDLIPAAYLDACRINGGLYAIPAYKDSSMTNYFVWTKDQVEAYYPDYAEHHTLAEIDAGLRAVKEGTGVAPLLLNQDGISCITGNKYDACTLGSFGIGITYKGGTEFVAVYEQPDVMADLEILHTWMNDGLINSDAAVLSEATGMCGVGVAQGWPSAAKGWGEGRGAEVVVSQFEDTVVSNDTVMGSMTCISASSAHKAEALKLLELVNTDYIVRDMLGYGEEGVNFEYVEENGERRVKKLNSDWTMAAYTQGTFFDWTLEAGNPVNYWVEEVQKQNENAIASPAMGFIPDVTNIADQIAGCKAVFEEYKALLMTGTGEPEATVAQMMDAMRASGFDDILAEVNAQYQAWLASK